MLLDHARLPAPAAAAVQRIAHGLAETVREQRLRAGGIDALLHQYPLNSAEGLALMSLAEALLRIPDHPTANLLLRDQLAKGHWLAATRSAAQGTPPEVQSLFVSLASKGLVLAGRFATRLNHSHLMGLPGRLLARAGEPFVRLGAYLALQTLGQKFVLGETIEEALDNSATRMAQGYRFSYDMLGEAALTLQDALRYTASYEHAIHAVGKAAAGLGESALIRRPSISVKLSALHPRFEQGQRERVLAELAPRLAALCRLAQRFGIGLTVDAEESHRLELTLDVMEALAREPEFANYEGLGFAVQAYNKRAPLVIDWIAALARETDHRFMVRLVKGAYWDTEIKRAQVDGQADYPVYTHKAYTDTAYLACARKLFDAGSAVYPQFATQNAHTAAAIYAMGRNKPYEYQCLHGMGELLYDQIVGHDPGAGLNDDYGDDFEEDQQHTCRIYAPVGPHDTLLAYLVRRLLENGANNSFVNRVLEPGVSISTLVADPVAQTELLCAHTSSADPNPIALPVALFNSGSTRRNSLGLDLTNEIDIATLEDALAESRATTMVSLPLVAGQALPGPHRVVRNPAQHTEVVGVVIDTPFAAVTDAVTCALAAAPRWAATPVEERATRLEHAADLLQERLPDYVALAVREAGKTWASAVAEVREAIDFLRYYAVQAREVLPEGQVQVRARGPLVAISPWNFPLAIFVGQVSAALVAGNTVLAKPAEQTPLIAFKVVNLLHEAGIPSDALQLLPGPGETVGAALVADPRIAGVLFTGSLAVAREIAQTLSQRDDDVLFIAETGGINAMIVDSSALPEQVVADVLTSAFDSAGQRCSALRVLCLQNDIADRVLVLLKGAMDELVVGDPSRLDTDVGPVIDDETQMRLLTDMDALKSSARSWHQTRVTAHVEQSTFVPPTLAEVERVQNVKTEIFGPVLHVVRFAADELDTIIDAINASGYGLTHGLHSRIDATVQRVCQRIRAGNIYVNRNMVGAVVGVQPFGGEGMSGTGPKAGGPLYLRALVRSGAASLLTSRGGESCVPSPSRGGLGWGWASTAPAKSPIEALPHPHPYPPLEGEGVRQGPSIDSAVMAMGSNIPASAQRLLDTPLPALDASARTRLAERVAHYAAHTPLQLRIDLPGPTGERNTLSFAPRGLVACVADELEPLALLCAAALACDNRVVLPTTDAGRALAAVLADAAVLHPDPAAQEFVTMVLFNGPLEPARQLRQQVAARNGALVGLIHATTEPLDLTRLVVERCVCINTTAWGGNAALMSAAQ